MTTTHFLHPEDEFQECDWCQVWGGLDNEWICGPCRCQVFPSADRKSCSNCNGTRKIRTDAKPEIEIKAYEDLSNSGTLYVWRKKVPDQRYWAKAWSRPFPTEARAVKAGRKKLSTPSAAT